MVNSRLGPSSNANLTDHNSPWEKRHAVQSASPRNEVSGIHLVSSAAMIAQQATFCSA